MNNRIKTKWDSLPLTVKVSTAYVICSIIQRCLSFFTLPLFTRLLTTEQYGQFVIYQSWMGIISIFITLNLAYGSFSTAMVKYEKDRAGYISSVEGICLFLAGIFLLVYLPFQSLWNQLFELPTLFVCIMVIEILATTAVQLWSGKKRFEFKYKSVVFVTLLIAFSSPILAYLLVISTADKGYARILGYALIAIIVGLFFFVFNLCKGKKTFNKKYWQYALGFNIPLLAYYLSQVVFNQSDRIMISHMVGIDKAAIYGVVYSLSTILTFVLNAVNNSYVPWYYGKIKEGKQSDNKTVSFGIAVLMSILLLGIIWFAPEIVYIFAGQKYMEAIYVVPPVAISILLLFYSQLFINVEFFYEEKKKLVWASIIAAIVNIVLNYICISIFGFIAAAYTTLASYIIFALFNYNAMKRLLKDRDIIDNAYNYKSLIILFFAFCGVAAIGAFTYDWLFIRIIIAIIILLILVSKKGYFINIYKTIKR